MTSAPRSGGTWSVEAMQRLEGITDVALAHFEIDDLLRELLDRVRDALDVDTVAVLLLDEERQELVARAAKGLEEEVKRGVRIPAGRGFAGSVAARRAPVVVPDIDQIEVLNPLLREVGIRSLLGVPLLTAGRVVGVLHVGSLTPRAFQDSEVNLLELAAGRLGPAIDHARLYRAERDARAAAEAAVTELRALQGIADAALSHLDLEEMLLELLDRVRAALGGDTAAILLLDDESNELVARAARGLEEEVERGVRIPVGKGFAGRIAAERRVIAIEDIAQADVVNPLLREHGIVSLLGAPLIAADEVRGVMHVGVKSHRVFSSDDTRLLRLTADRVALALDRAYLLREHQLALALQRNLLPERMPEIPGVSVAARYLPGHGAMVGGDWYDVFPLPDGGVGLAMGDVASRGIRAASVMGQLRHAVRTYALEGDTPAELVARVSSLVRSLDRREMATLVYVAIAQSGRELRYVSAGHPPAVVVESGRARFLEDVRNAPLGALPYPYYEEGRSELAHESLIVLYTDGLVERKGRSIDSGLKTLADAAARSAGDPERVADELIEAVGARDSDDDVALIVGRTSAEQADLIDLHLPAIGDSLGVLRNTLRRWLADNGATRDDVIDVLVGVSEAAGNAVEHAYGPGDATFEVAGSISGCELQIAVRDHGHWRAPRGRNRGRGTMLMQATMDSFEIRSTRSGTEVLMRRRLGRDPE